MDALAALAIDRKHRRDLPDGPGGDLWTIDQVAKAPKPSFSCAHPTVAPERWDLNAANARISNKEYAEAFATEFPEVAAMLADCDNLVVGGGAAAWPLGDRMQRPADVDIFVVDCAPETPTPDLWRRVAAATDHLTRQATRDDGVVRQVAIPGLITVFIDYLGEQKPDGRNIDRSRRLKVQFVLRAYRSVTALLHAVDGIVPTAFDGRIAYTTTLGAFEHAHNTIVVDTDLRSISYERRLHNYFARNYALQFPRMSRAAFAAGQELKLGDSGAQAQPLTIKITDRGGLLAFGTVSVPNNPHFDYDPTLAVFEVSNRSHQVESMVELFMIRSAACRSGMATHIIRQLPIGEVDAAFNAQTLETIRAIVTLVPPTSCTIPSTLKLSPECIERLRDVPEFKLGDGVSHAGALALNEWAEHGPPSLEQLFDYSCLSDELVERQRNICRNFGQLKLQDICELFKVGPATLREIACEAATIVAAASAAAASAADAAATKVAKENIQQMLTEAAAAVIRWFDRAAHLPVAWWVTVEPGRQWTAAYNPRTVTAADWYGATFEPADQAVEPAVESAATIAALTLAAGRRPAPFAGTTYGSECSICLMPVRRGDLNTCTLSCGHVVHWADPPRCGGLRSCTKKTCPLCRK